jgi:hypothetical protein
MAEDALAFMNLMLLLGTMTTRRLDEIAASPADRRNALLHTAREYIDMLASLKKRTGGRLTDDETRIMDTLLKDLQTRYVKALASR